ncbi:hypothetical protein U1Q18_049438 [Sarracenia purpurea var. burkii]
MTYVEPGDEVASTYTFCTDYSTHGKGLLGELLDENTPSRECKFSVDFIREQIKDTKGKPIPCGNDDEISGYWKYKTDFKLLIGNVS